MKLNLRNYLLFLFCPLVFGCSPEPKASNVPTETVGGIPSDPVANYEEFMANEFSRLKQKAPDFAVNDTFKFDVSKTDSLVSPLVATCSFDFSFPYMNPEGDLMVLFRASVTMTYGWQQGRWVQTTGKMTTSDGVVMRGNMDEGRELIKRTKGVSGKLGAIDDIAPFFSPVK